MRITKSTQKLLKTGVELIIQAEARGVVHVRISVVRRFGSRLQADNWWEENRQGIQNAIKAVESVSVSGGGGRR